MKNKMKIIYQTMIIISLFSLFSCNLISGSNKENNNNQQTNGNVDTDVSFERIVNAQKLQTYLKKYDWISEDFSVTLGNNDPEYDETQAMTFNVQDNNLIMYNPSGTVYYTFDISVDNLSSIEDVHEKPYFKLKNDDNKLLTFAIVEYNTLDSRGYDNIELYIIHKNDKSVDNTILPNRYYMNFMKNPNSNSGNNSSNEEIINSIKGNWKYNSNSYGNINTNITDSKITVTWAGETREANYTVNNNKITITYKRTENGMTADYTGTFDIVIKNNSFEITSSDINSGSVFGMFFGMTSTSTPYKITFTK